MSVLYVKENGEWKPITTIKGQKGDKGDKGDTALSVTVGNTETLPSDVNAYVVNDGTDTDLILDFGIPQGAKGDRGASGRGVDIGTIIQSLSKKAPEGFINTWGETIMRTENEELYEACTNGTLPTVNASNGGVTTIYAPNGIFKQTTGTNTLDINSDVVIELAKIGGVVDWNGIYNPQPTGNITLASFNENVETQVLMFTEGGLNEVHFRLVEGPYSGKLSSHPTSPVNNTVYFNTTTKTYYIYEGGNWNEYGAEGVGYIWLGAIIVTADPATATWDDAPFVSADTTSSGLSQYDLQLINNNGNCGYFGLDTVEQSVRVPTMKEVFLEEDSSNPGSYKPAGLPNITGEWNWVNGALATSFASGAVSTRNGGTSQYTGTSSNARNYAIFDIDASRSNPIYKDINTVQPEAISVYFYVCVNKYTDMEKGPYFTPHVDSDGILSWTNNGGLINPEPTDIKGPAAFTLRIGEVDTVPYGEEATVTNVGSQSNQIWDISIPQGKQGNLFTGQTIFSLDPIIDAGIHLLDGTLLTVGGMNDSFITDYISNLYTNYPQRFCTEAEWQTSVTTYGVCGKYVYTEGVSVRLPKVTGIVEGTLDVNALGDIIEAGLPNITGKITPNATTSDTLQGIFEGAFYKLEKGQKGGAASDYYTNAEYGMGFDASRSNAIYGNSTTVQPQTIKGYYYIVVATTTKTQIEADIDNIVTDLNGKADVDLSNTNPSQSFKDNTLSWIIPDYSLGITVLSNVNNVSGSYTAPSKGIFYMSNTAAAQEKTLSVNGYVVLTSPATSGQYSFQASALVKENDIITYTNGRVCKFFPL